MENYTILGTIGEGTYGVVLKCKHKETGQLVAIKKFKESDEDEQVRKTALREIRILKQLKHENIVTLIEVFRRKGKLYLVFEFVEKTILEELERHPDGLDPLNVKKLMWQLVRSISFCHSQEIIHRDVKPENLLVSKNGILKLCDFGFARNLASPSAKYTDYVSTRWYRAPELLVGDVSYGKAVDVWAMGCLCAEMMNGLPLFPGESDIDQLFHIIKCFGKLVPPQVEHFRQNPFYAGVRLPQVEQIETLKSRFPDLPQDTLSLLECMLKCDPFDRATCSELLDHEFFQELSETYKAGFQEAFEQDEIEFPMRKKKNQKSTSLINEDFSIKKTSPRNNPNYASQKKDELFLPQEKEHKKGIDHKEFLDDYFDEDKPSRSREGKNKEFLPFEVTRDFNSKEKLPNLVSSMTKPDRLLAFPNLSLVTLCENEDYKNRGMKVYYNTKVEDNSDGQSLYKNEKKGGKYPLDQSNKKLFKISPYSKKNIAPRATHSSHGLSSLPTNTSIIYPTTMPSSTKSTSPSLPLFSSKQQPASTRSTTSSRKGIRKTRNSSNKTN